MTMKKRRELDRTLSYSDLRSDTFIPAVRVGAFAKVRLRRVLGVAVLPVGHSLVRDSEQRLVLRQALLTVSRHESESK
jgi:hypothetical protein